MKGYAGRDSQAVVDVDERGLHRVNQFAPALDADVGLHVGGPNNPQTSFIECSPPLQPQEGWLEPGAGQRALSVAGPHLPLLDAARLITTQRRDHGMHSQRFP